MEKHKDTKSLDLGFAAKKAIWMEARVRSFLSKARTNSTSGCQEGEGYICPACHEEQASPEELEVHHAAKHAHICPHCLQGLPTPDDLVHHYAMEHASELGPSEGEQIIQDLKWANINLSCEVRLLEQLIANQTKEKDGSTIEEKIDVKDGQMPGEGESAVKILARDDIEVLAGNSQILLEHCKKLVDNLRVKATVAKQVLVETQQRLEGLEREEAEVGKRLQRLVDERREVVRRGEIKLANHEKRWSEETG